MLWSGAGLWEDTAASPRPMHNTRCGEGSYSSRLTRRARKGETLSGALQNQSHQELKGFALLRVVLPSLGAHLEGECPEPAPGFASCSSGLCPFMRKQTSFIRLRIAMETAPLCGRSIEHLLVQGATGTMAGSPRVKWCENPRERQHVRVNHPSPFHAVFGHSSCRGVRKGTQGGCSTPFSIKTLVF